MSNLYDALVSACTGVDPKFPVAAEKETTEAFGKRVIRLISDVPEDVWDKLPESVQEWFNLAAEALTKERSLPDIDGFPNGAAPAAAKRGKKSADNTAAKSEPAPEPVASAEPTTISDDDPRLAGLKGLALHNAKKKLMKEAGIVPAAKPAAGAAADKTDPAKREREAADKPAKEPKARVRSAESVGHMIRTFVANNLTATADDIRAHLVSLGRSDVKTTTINTFKTDFLGGVAAIKETGHWQN